MSVLGERWAACYRVARYRPLVSLAIVALSLLTAALEGVGLSFLFPIVELAQGNVDPAEATGLMAVFVALYAAVGVPFTFEYLVLGVASVMTVRYTSRFLVIWFQEALQIRYTRHLQREAYTESLAAEMAHVDAQGTDETLNVIVTEAEYAGKVIKYLIQMLNQALVVVVYLLLALLVSPALTVVSIGFLGALALVFRYLLGGGGPLGDRVADANERIQTASQEGIQGLHEVKTFGLDREYRERFEAAVGVYTRASVLLARNEAAISHFYTLTTALSIFALLYVAVAYFSLSLGLLGVFFFAMLRLGPQMSGLISRGYKLDGQLPHLLRTHAFIDRLEANAEPDAGADPMPTPFERLSFEDVGFSYAPDQPVLEDVSFTVGRGEFVAFVGPSGAGKSTIAALLSRLYTPDSGRILVNDPPAGSVDLRAWRSRISMVRQNPYVFDETLRYNLTLGARDATPEAIARACRIARVDEFLPGLPEGYETRLGDDGVRLSGGQRQRVALARALLKDADVLVLDEATSDLDSHLEREVHEAIEAADREYAVVAIAHRLSTVRNADRIYTVVDGRITEVGPHRDLVERDGTYARLHHLQSGPDPTA